MATRAPIFARLAAWAGLSGVSAAEAAFVFGSPTWPHVRLVLALDLAGLCLVVIAMIAAAFGRSGTHGGSVG